jgi:hypothetical protein
MPAAGTVERGALEGATAGVMERVAEGVEEGEVGANMMSAEAEKGEVEADMVAVETGMGEAGVVEGEEERGRKEWKRGEAGKSRGGAPK